MKRLLFDQGLPRSAGSILAQQGWDVVHVADIGLSRGADTEILERGREERRVCFTLDTDFHALLATSGEQTRSVVRVRKEGLDGKALAALVETIWPRIEEAVSAGAMVTVTATSLRIRRLPIAKRQRNSR